MGETSAGVAVVRVRMGNLGLDINRPHTRVTPLSLASIADVELRRHKPASEYLPLEVAAYAGRALQTRIVLSYSMIEVELKLER